MARGPLRISRAAHPRTVKHLGPGTLDFHLRHVRGGKRAIMEEIAPLAMQFEPRLEPAIRKWHQLTQWQRRFVTLDDLATEADLTKGQFLSAIVRAGFEFSEGITDLLVACAFPSVVAASVKRPKTLNGSADRQLLFEHMSALSMTTALEQAADKARRAAGTNDTGAMDPDYLGFLRKDPDGNAHRRDQ
jgi:hypothetical protein